MKKLRLKLIAITVAIMTTATLPSLNASAAWIQNGSNWNYLSDSGERKTGWINDNGTWYYLDNSATMKTGWVNDDGTWYYMQPSGEMKTGWINDNGTWYFAAASGEMQTGVVKVENKIYYFDVATGAMQTENVMVNGKVYIFAQTGEATGKDIPTFNKMFYSNGIGISDTNSPEKNNNGSDISNSSTTPKQKK